MKFSYRILFIALTSLSFLSCKKNDQNQPPVANAGESYTIWLPANTVTLTGYGTDADGSVVGYSWSQIDGPQRSEITDPNQSSTHINNLTEGKFIFKLIVTDNNGAVGTDTVSVDVNPSNDQNQPPVANAGESYTIWLPANTVTLTGYGTDADGSVVGYSWSQIDGPQQSEITTPNQSSTHINNLAEGKFIFKLIVTDNNGAVGTDTVSVNVNPSLIDTLVLQPDQNPNEVTIAGNNYGYDVSNPNWIEILAAAWTSGGEAFQIRNAFEFDLNSIPANATIESATLSLYSNPNPQNGDLIHANSGPDNAMLIQRITTPWQAGDVNWVHQPSSTTEDQVVIASTNSSFLDLTGIDVTKMVTKMVNNNQNYGFLIRLQTEQMYNSRIFCSSKHSDQAKHPKLTVVYKKS